MNKFSKRLRFAWTELIIETGHAKYPEYDKRCSRILLFQLWVFVYTRTIG